MMKSFTLKSAVLASSLLLVGCQKAENQGLDASVSELEAFEKQQQADREADIKAMGAADKNASP